MKNFFLLLIIGLFLFCNITNVSSIESDVSLLELEEFSNINNLKTNNFKINFLESEYITFLVDDVVINLENNKKVEISSETFIYKIKENKLYCFKEDEEYQCYIYITLDKEEYEVERYNNLINDLEYNDNKIDNIFYEENNLLETKSLSETIVFQTNKDYYFLQNNEIKRIEIKLKDIVAQIENIDSLNIYTKYNKNNICKCSLDVAVNSLKIDNKEIEENFELTELKDYNFNCSCFYEDEIFSKEETVKITEYNLKSLSDISNDNLEDSQIIILSEDKINIKEYFNKLNLNYKIKNMEELKEIISYNDNSVLNIEKGKIYCLLDLNNKNQKKCFIYPKTESEFVIYDFELDLDTFKIRNKKLKYLNITESKLEESGIINLDIKNGNYFFYDNNFYLVSYDFNERINLDSLEITDCKTLGLETKTLKEINNIEQYNYFDNENQEKNSEENPKIEFEEGEIYKLKINNVEKCYLIGDTLLKEENYNLVKNLEDSFEITSEDKFYDENLEILSKEEDITYNKDFIFYLLKNEKYYKFNINIINFTNLIKINDYSNYDKNIKLINKIKESSISKKDEVIKEYVVGFINDIKSKLNQINNIGISKENITYLNLEESRLTVEYISSAKKIIEKILEII